MSAEPPIWTPSLFRIADANLTRFMAFAAARGAEAADYDALYRWCKEGKSEAHTWNPQAYRP